HDRSSVSAQDEQGTLVDGNQSQTVSPQSPSASVPEASIRLGHDAATSLVSTTCESVLCSQEWSDFLASLDFCSAKLSDAGGAITALTLTGMEKDNQEQMVVFLSTPHQKEIVLSMEPGMLKFLQLHHQGLLADMGEVILFPLETGDGLSGESNVCQSAAELLSAIIGSIFTKTIVVTQPGISRFLLEEEGVSILAEMTAKFEVYIDMAKVHWEPLEDGVTYPALLSILMFLIYSSSSAPMNACSLDEDASFLLAIQMSMELNQRSDAEDIQKALELSRSDSMPNQENTQLERAFDMSLEDAIKLANKAEICVFANYNHDLVRVDIALGKKVGLRQCEEKVENKNLRKLSSHQKRCIELIKRKHAVEISIQGTTAVLSGFKEHVSEAVMDLKNVLRRTESMMTDAEIVKTVQWVWYEQGSSSKAIPYPPDATVFIENVDKLMNKLLHDQYRLKKVSIERSSSEAQVERTLYHGTSETSVKEICIHGFNRSFCGKNATVYGQGVYFAVNGSLSVSDTYSPPNADGHKFIFVARVLTGDFTVGKYDYKTAPLKESSGVPVRYHSVTDQINSPTLFVIFNDTQAYPQYLITCKKIYG
uniref:Poly [ADP-ribose] polymerase n=1 Tax=Sinocyclocheilus grahami TaxID=75366 RepID=A0A672NAS4_SINGR